LTYRFHVAPSAEAQIRDAANWWIENRPKAPEAFAEDVERAFEIISSLPGTGEPVFHSRLKGLRRLLMGRVRYHLYYHVDQERETVEVLALWHTSRGTTPTL
jgi:plasmid stabilization system protein ParE